MADGHCMLARSTNRRAINPDTGELPLIAVTQERLKDLFDYDPETGVFRHRRTAGRVKAGEVAGCVQGSGYHYLSVDCAKVLAHRAAWLYVYGVPPSDLLDHRDRNPLNNAISNLREADKSKNAQNMKKKPNCSSALMGVSWNVTRRKWVAQIKVQGRHFGLGYFDSEAEAGRAYQVAKARLHEFGAEGLHGSERRASPCGD